MPVAIIFAAVIQKELCIRKQSTKKYIKIKFISNPMALTRNTNITSFKYLPSYLWPCRGGPGTNDDENCYAFQNTSLFLLRFL